jgi:hypothetical protein
MTAKKLKRPWRGVRQDVRQDANIAVALELRKKTDIMNGIDESPWMPKHNQ